MKFMKKSIVAFLAVFLIAVTTLNAARIKVSWQPNPEADIAGYRVHYGAASREYTTTVDAGNVTNLIMVVPDGQTLFFAITAYNTSQLESDYSNELAWPPPAPPAGLKIEILPDEEPAP